MRILLDLSIVGKGGFVINRTGAFYDSGKKKGRDGFFDRLFKVFIFRCRDDNKVEFTGSDRRATPTVMVFVIALI